MNGKSYVFLFLTILLISCSSSTTSKITFRDNFNGELADGWFWANEDPNRWSISSEDGGWLMIIADDSSMLHQSEIIGQTNVLVRSAPDGDFTLTSLLSTQPLEDFQQAGIYIIEDGFDYVGIFVSYCKECISGSGGKIIEMKAVRDNQPILEGAFITRPENAGDEISLRLVYTTQGNSITGYYASGESNWHEAFKVDDVPTFDKVGLGTSNSPGPNGVQKDLVARFGYFELSKPDTNSSTE